MRRILQPGKIYRPNGNLGNFCLSP